MWQNQLSSPNRHLWPRDAGCGCRRWSASPVTLRSGLSLLLEKPGRWVGRVSHQVAPVMLWRKRQGGLWASSAVDAHHHYQQRFSLLTRKIAVEHEGRTGGALVV